VHGPQDGEGNSLWNRLRRRKVVQWGIAYAAGAWGFLQGLAYVSSLLNWPAQLQKLTGLALLIGLPVALVLAWYHGDRGHRRVTRTELAILTGLFLLGGAIFWRYQHATETPAMASSPAATAANPPAAALPPAAVAGPDPKSIAVLPFADMSPGKDQEYMSDGMAEELLNLLAKAPDLKVIARTSSFAFKGKDVDIAEIARKLNVAHVLEGSVRKSGNKIRITAQLIRASDSTHLWSETFDRPLDDIFAVQDEIADAIAQALQIKLKGGSLERRDGGTQNLEAYQLYLRSGSAMYQNTQSALDAAGKYLEQAIKLDPNYGLAWLQLGDVVALQTDNGYLGVAEGYGRARQLAQHALQLSPDLARAHSTLQYVHQTLDWDWTAAKAEQQRALAIDPGNPWALLTAGTLSITLGQWNDAVRQLSESLSLDPLNTYTILNLGQAYYLSGRFEEAEGAFRKLLELEPGFLWARRWLGKTLLAQSKPDEALATVQQEVDENERLALLPVFLQAVGRQAEADVALQAVTVRFADANAYWLAQNYAYRGDPELALQWLERAYKQKDIGLVTIVGEPLFKSLYEDPRFNAFLRKMKLPETPWPATGST
jgi:TolB-like protein/Tfp pilus assembly protein PilF